MSSWLRFEVQSDLVNPVFTNPASSVSGKVLKETNGFLYILHALIRPSRSVSGGIFVAQNGEYPLLTALLIRLLFLLSARVSRPRAQNVFNG